MLKACLALSLILIGGCAARPSCQEIPEMPRRAQPVQAMAPCDLEAVRRACKFRPEFADLLEDEKLAMMSNCFEIIGPELRACAAKHDRLSEWIRSP